MAPTRKSRSVNKRYSDYVEVSPSKNVANKSGRQKRKLSDMLGSPWTDEEVERFYKAYRKYGKDWKKVAAMVRTRNSEMVEALYTMNRAYLSLPEGTASVVGFIAMVSDHYNAMEGSDNDQESHDIPKPIHKPKKRSHGLLQQNGGEEQLHSRLVVGSSGRSLPQLKRRESDGCTVRKRTPRFPINHSSRRDNNNNIGNYPSPYKRSQRREVDDVAHGAALALTEASQRGGSPHVSQSPYHMKSTPLKGRQKILDTVRTKRHGNLIDEELFEGSSGSGGAENEGYQKGRKFYGQKDDNDLDDGGEACSGTGEGLAVGVGGKFDENIEHSSQGKRKKNKKLLFRDETSALDALQTLADLSLMIQSSKGDDSPVLKEDKPATGTNDNNAPGRPGSTSNRRHKTKVSVEKEKVANEFPRGESSKSGKSKSGREVKVDYKALSEGKQKRKNKSTSFEVFIVEEKPTDKLLHFNSNANAPLKNSKSTRLVEYSSSNSNTSRTGADSAVSTAVVPASDGVELPSKRRKKRKMDRNIISKTGEMKLTKVNSKDQLNKKSETLERANNLKEKAFHCLSSSMVRRWCTYEWFYSAIDYPWFAKREFVEYLNHVGLGHIPRLTNVEWGVIRSSLGKPRRFSENFLREERGKLWQYRESVREHYTELRSGAREGLPTDLARPLSVGQRVIALHPELREVHDGSVLTVDNDKCRVQFDRPELGVAFVKDVDCMPLNLLDNMPEALRREMSALYRFSMISGEPRLPRHHSLVHTSSEHFEPGPTIALMNHRLGQNGSGAPADNVVISQHQHAAASQIQARETDIHALSELTRALDKKEAILKELKLVNDSLSSHKNETGVPMNVSESFKKEYAMVLLQLKEASDQVASALANLRRRNTYPGIPMPPWQKPNPDSGPVVDPTASNFPSNNNNELAPNVIEILKSSRNEAHKLVHTALQGMSKIKEEHNNNVRSSVVAVLDCLGVGKNPSEHGSSSSIRSSEQSNGNIYNNKRVTNETEAKIPFDLIVSCVATYHMIQSCTERQYPPGDVVQMLDSAFRNLHPQSPQNLGIFREIEMCMGRVKTQILALVPS